MADDRPARDWLRKRPAPPLRWMPEARVLDRLAAETARTNCPWTAATNLFGDRS